MPTLLGFAYTQEGEGRDVLLLHGWGANKESFAYVTRTLAKRFRVTAVDLYGFGESAPPPAPYRVGDYANRVAFFCGLAGIKPYCVVGHSFGGRVAIKLLAQDASFSKKLVLVDSAGIKPRRGVKYYGRVALYKTLRRLPFVDKEKLLKRFGSQDYRCLSPVMRETFKLVVNEDLSPCLASIRAETLLLWGENDTETPLYMAKKLNAGIRGSGLVVMERAGHFSFIDRPQYFCKVLMNFLGV